MRRKSCFCSHCGQSTRFEIKNINVTNPIRMRKRMKMIKVLKAVNFLKQMNSQCPSAVTDKHI